MSTRAELQEIAHTGGKVTFDVKIDADGRLTYSVSWQHSRPTAAAVFAVYAIQQGVAVGDIRMAGINTPWNDPPVSGCYPVFICSDSTGMFGHECPACSGYWRAQHGGRICPYCASIFDEGYQLLTQAQRQYVAQYCELLGNALRTRTEGKHIIDMDAVAEASGKDAEKPAFYYAEESQQNLFTCAACDGVTDILGKYAYCGTCGTRNDLAEFEKTIRAVRARINSGGPFEPCVRDAVAAFDSFAGHLATELVTRVPMTAARKARLDKALFHNVERAAELFASFFDINILAGCDKADVAFGALMFHRRHVYEHKGGEADEAYIAATGDNVRLKQALRETSESSHRLCGFVTAMAKSLDRGFHELFPPERDMIERRNTRRSTSRGEKAGR